MTPPCPTIQETILLVTRLHQGQADKTGAPYVQHPIAVASMLTEGLSDDDGSFRRRFYVNPEIEQDVVLAALLHDVLEDTNTDVEELLSLGFPKRVVSTVELLTKPKGMSYVDFINRIVESKSVRAVLVKLADITHNSHPDRLSGLDEETRARLLKKYQPAYQTLVEAVDGLSLW